MTKFKIHGNRTVKSMIHLLEDVLQSHADYLYKVIDKMSAGTISPEDATKAAQYDACRIGVWLDGLKGTYGGTESFLKICEVHAEFHRNTANIMTAYFNGNSKLAISSLESIVSMSGGGFCTVLEALTAFTRKLDDESIRRF